MNKKMVLSLIVILLFIAALQPVSASYLMDSGKKPVYNHETGKKVGYWYYKTWNEGSTLHTKVSAYTYSYGNFLNVHLYLKKTNHTTLKIYSSHAYAYSPTEYHTEYLTTSKTATAWYWKKPLINNIIIRASSKDAYWYLANI